MAKILIIEDSEEVRSLLEIFLGKEGFAVLSIGTGKEGIALTKQEKPDLILLDMHLPDLSGKETLRQIRAFDRNVKIYYFSGLYTEELEKEALLDGATGFLNKGAEFASIVKVVASALAS